MNEDRYTHIEQTTAFRALKSQLHLLDHEKLEVEQMQAAPRKMGQPTRNSGFYSRELILRLIHWFKDN